MRHYIAIAINSYIEARHNKVLHVATIFVALLILFSLFMGEVSLHQNEKVVKDIGLASISLLGVFMATYLGITGLYQDLEKRTIYSLIAKPIDRREILFGKYFGMALVLTTLVIMMTIYLYLVTSFMEASVDFYLLPAIGLILMELLVVAAFAVFFSSFSTPILSGFFTVGMFLVGRITYELSQFGGRSKNPVFRIFAKGIQKVYDLEAFDLRARVVHKLPIYFNDFWLPVLYATALILALLITSSMIFNRRDFK